MALTRRQLIQGALAAMAAAVALRPLASPKSRHTHWRLSSTDLLITYSDRPDDLVYGYWDPAVGWRHFRGQAARDEMARQAAAQRSNSYIGRGDL